jgi:uncharacterized protein YkwD
MKDVKEKKRNRIRRTFKKYFVPHEENDHKPHLLRPGTVAFVLAIALAVEGAFWFGAAVIAPRSRLFGIIVANTLVDETNQSRTSNGDAALTVNPLLEEAAQEKANDMVSNNYFAHTSPAGLSPWYWFEQVGYQFDYAGENLAVNFSDSSDVTNAWMNSPEHRANILDTDFTQIGIATAQGTYEGHSATYVVELFGTPAPAAPPGELAGLVNSASAATGGTGAAKPIATTKPVVTMKPITKPKPAPTLAEATSTATSTAIASGSAVVAVEGISSETVAVLTPITSGTPSTSTALAAASIGSGAGGSVVGLVQPVSQSNPIQALAANPRQAVDYLYLAIIALFALALGINAFVKVPVRYAHLIFGGMLVILVVGLLIIINNHTLAGAVIL